MIITPEQERLRFWMRMAIDAGKNSKQENEETKPKVGAVLVKDINILATAFRGELGLGDHAEYTLIHKKLNDSDLTGTILFTTLEPCTSRKSKTPCTDWIIKSGIKKVYIGMLDPNPIILGQGFNELKENGLEVEHFPPDLTKEIEIDNHEFIKFCELLNNKKIKTLEDLPYHISPNYRKLDDWYSILNRIYFDKNYSRTTNQIFSHLVEILGGLSVLSTHKKEKLVKTEEHLAKALAWWLALCGKVGIRSVEDLIFYKFPNVCPYCQETPHKEDKCLNLKIKGNGPEWNQLLALSKKNERPSSISSWQQMFFRIYPISQTESYDTVFGRFSEELGELSEAIRTLQVSPTYFLSEAADVFAWLMHLSNLYETIEHRGIALEERGKYLENILFELYPDKCRDCDHLICACPSVLKSTIGRISHDGPDLKYFLDSANPFLSKSEIAAQFDYDTKKIIIGNETIEPNSDWIKSIYRLSKELSHAIRKNEKLNHSCDRILECLQNVMAFASTQRINQHILNKFLRAVLDLDKVYTDEFLIELKRIEKNEFVIILEKYITTANISYKK